MGELQEWKGRLEGRHVHHEPEQTLMQEQTLMLQDSVKAATDKVPNLDGAFQGVRAMAVRDLEDGMVCVFAELQRLRQEVDSAGSRLADVLKTSMVRSTSIERRLEEVISVLSSEITEFRLRLSVAEVGEWVKARSSDNQAARDHSLRGAIDCAAASPADLATSAAP